MMWILIVLCVLCALLIIICAALYVSCKFYQIAIKNYKLANRFNQSIHSIWVEATKKMLYKLKDMGEIKYITDIMDEIRDKSTDITIGEASDKKTKDDLGDIIIPDYLPEDF